MFDYLTLIHSARQKATRSPGTGRAYRTSPGQNTVSEYTVAGQPGVCKGVTVALKGLAKGQSSLDAESLVFKKSSVQLPAELLLWAGPGLSETV